MKKINIELVTVNNINEALHAMRNPMNSWDLSTTEKDFALSQKLTKAGPEHAKHLRFVDVILNIDAPRYWWQEFDTYKYCEKISCSTMHKLTSKRLTNDDFTVDLPHNYLNLLNQLIDEYTKSKDSLKFAKLKGLLPEGFMQKRTIKTNYANLLHIYKQRHNHKLTEWKVFCKFIETNLPHWKDLIGEDYAI